MPLASDACICLRKLDYSETSQILMLLSRNYGIIRVIAKGAHRKTKAGASRFDGGIDLLDVGHAVFSADLSRELSLLTDWKLEDGHLNLRQKLRPLYLALYAAELVSLLFQEHDPHPEVFDQLQKILQDLATPQLEQAFLAFELDLLREAGFMPELTTCINCAEPAIDRNGIFFAPSRGGVVCRNCHAGFPDRLPLDIRLLRLLQMIQPPTHEAVTRRLPQLTRHQTDPLNSLLIEHIQHALGQRLRSAYYVLAGRRHPDAKTDRQLACNSMGHEA
ncbi:MAG TPA: DNA repair protein RecO [Tepidisphaeraceae bacterium]|jgi:DNA repair protein RecO (recombination protein O)